MPADARDLRECLERKLGGVPSSGSHIFILIYDDDGTLLTKAMISHGRRELSDHELALVARNLGVPIPLLRECAECSAGGETLLPLIRRKAAGS